MRLRQNNKGFTLIEVMLTTVIAVFVITSLMWASLATQHSVKMGMIFFEAGNLAKSKIENIRATAYAAVVSSVSNNVLLSDNGSTATTADDIFGTVTTTVTDNGNQTKTVLVNVSWTTRMLGEDTVHQTSLTTMVDNL